MYDCVQKPARWAIAFNSRLVLLSNSTAPGISALYETNREAADAGLSTFRVPARRAINSNASRRGSVDEYLITNIPASEGVA